MLQGDACGKLKGTEVLAVVLDSADHKHPLLFQIQMMQMGRKVSAVEPGQLIQMKQKVVLLMMMNHQHPLEEVVAFQLVVAAPLKVVVVLSVLADEQVDLLKFAIAASCPCPIQGQQLQAAFCPAQRARQIPY